jgi:hypothetical protein
MTDQSVELRRDELYEKVRSTPVHGLSKELGVSDVCLAKLYRRLQIPIPGGGYWRRLETGQKVARIPLPLCQLGDECIFDIQPATGRRVCPALSTCLLAIVIVISRYVRSAQRSATPLGAQARADFSDPCHRGR